MPRLITSTPAAFFSAIFRSSSANRYGGRRSRRYSVAFSSFSEFLAQRAGVHGPRPAGQVSRAGPRRPRPRARRRRAQRSPGCPRRAARRPRPRRSRRCRTPSSPPPRARRCARGSGRRPSRRQNDTFVRFGNSSLRSIAGPVALAGRAPRARRRPRSTHCGLPTCTNWKRELAPVRGERAAAVVGAGRVVALGAQARPAHVHACRCLARRCAAAPRPRRSRPRTRPRPSSRGAQVHDRLAHAVARQLGLRAVRVEDPHLGHEAVARRPRDSSSTPSEPTPGVRRAEGAHPRGGQLERKLTFLDDDVVVAERLPLLEAHGAGHLSGAP